MSGLMLCTLNLSICYDVSLCVTVGSDKIIFGKATKLLVEVGE